jgi:mRNA interferase YafQ
MLKQIRSNKFERDVIKQIKSGKDIEKLIVVTDLIADGTRLPRQYKDHPLSGNWKGFRDCHIEPDWLLIYKIEKDSVIFAQTGTHSYLFG